MIDLYHDREIETMDKEALGALQLLRYKKTVANALKTPFYKKRLRNVGIKSAEDLKSLSDIKKIPFTTKEDLREAYPFGLMASDREDVVRMHASSGTTGIPTVIYQTQGDLDRWTDLTTRSLVSVGCHRGDIFQ
ncbi:MAG: phenylacetate--CoA ligase, partial [Spirochaetales bacterium]|nr:phenylacetate--CoA ligase [Spirochaetales bacterium]